MVSTATHQLTGRRLGKEVRQGLCLFDCRTANAAPGVRGLGLEARHVVLCLRIRVACSYVALVFGVWTVPVFEEKTFVKVCLLN